MISVVCLVDYLRGGAAELRTLSRGPQDLGAVMFLPESLQTPDNDAAFGLGQQIVWQPIR